MTKMSETLHITNKAIEKALTTRPVQGKSAKRRKDQPLKVNPKEKQPSHRPSSPSL